ncbi:MAG: AarF/UbiB family protein [Bacteroidota bacterium]
MKTAETIPTSKFKRAGKIIRTGIKVGTNYASYYGEKLVGGDASRDKLDEKNATEIMDSLQELKGSGLKVAQMLSMEENLLPTAYAQQFSLAQFSVPPLSSPLVKKTFRKYFGKSPEEVFDKFDYDSKFAASIGQVHEAWLNGQKLAVKIQYPGVAESIRSDLALLKPLASRIMRIKLKDADRYFREVEDKLIEETDYNLELENSVQLTRDCDWMQDVIFPSYLPDYSNERIITMEWIEGQHLTPWLATNPSQEERNRIGKLLFDFFMYQIHELNMVHADPHPGNLLITKEGKLAVIDFGCVKEIPTSFYDPYFELLQKEALDDKIKFESLLETLEVLLANDAPDEREYFSDLFHQVLSLALRPYHQGRFDFSNDAYFKSMTEMGEQLTSQSLKSKYNPNRGSTHFIYLNRTNYGLYSLLHMLRAEIDTSIPSKQLATVG